MSDSVIRLRIDSKEYDANIKRAGDALTQYFQKVREGSKSLQDLDDDTMAAVKAMGELGTLASNTKGSLRELTQATSDMTVAYRALTDEEKKSPIGQAMAQSIAQMTERAGEMRDAMDDVNMSINNAASDTRMFDQMAQGMSVATAGFQGLTGAGKLLGIEMGNDVEVIAKLQAAMAVTNSLTTIQNALQKQSAFMQGVLAAKQAITTVAQQAYALATGEATAAQVAFNIAADANPYGLLLAAIGAVVGVISSLAVVLDDSAEEMDTFNGVMDETKKHVDDLSEAFRQLKESMELRGAGQWDIDSAEIDAIRDKKRELADALKSGKLSHEEFVELSQQLSKLQDEENRIVKKELEFEKYTQGLLNGGGAALKTTKEINAAIAALKKLQADIPVGSDYYNKISGTIEGLQGRLPQTTKGGTTGTGGKGDKGEKELTIQQQISELEKQAVAATEEERVVIGEKIRALDEELARRKKIVEEIHKVPAEPELFPDIPHKEEPKTPYEEMKDSLLTKMGDQGMALDTTTLTNLMKVAIQNGIEGVDADFSEIFENLPNGISDKTWQELVDKINGKLAEIGVDPIQIDFETGNVKKQSKEMAKDWNYAASAIQSVGKAMSKIEDPAAKVVSIMAESIASIALGFAQASVQASSMGPWGWIAWLGAGLAALTTTISTVHEVTGFANGGIVPGNSFSGDNLHTSDYGINSGELILSKSQQNNLAAQLTGSGNNATTQPYLDGEKIFLGMQAYTRRSGLGEIVTSER